MVSIEEPRSCNLSEYVFGIDFGTTNSLVALATDSSHVEIIQTVNKTSLLPSVVLYSGDEVQVGYTSDKNKSLHAIKRDMVKKDCDYNSILAASEIFKELQNMVFREKKIKLESAVVSVPSYFDHCSREAVLQAAKIANIDVVRLITEPTAAALSYGVSCDINNNVYVVYDLGGGTFDASVLKTVSGVFQVLATNGDNMLGGKDFDEQLLNYVLKKNKIDNISLSLKQDLLLIAEDVKIKLSSSENAIFEYNSLELSISCYISRKEFEDSIIDLVQKTINITSSVIKEANELDLKNILVVGGSTRLPIIRKLLVERFSDKVIFSDEPDTIVVKGAAIQGCWLSKNQKQSNKNNGLLIDVLPLSLGIETAGGIMERIISRNESLPVVVKQGFTTQIDGQKSIKIGVYQGENEMVVRNRELVSFEFDVVPMVAGYAKIDVEFRIDLDGLLTVIVFDLQTKKRHQVEINHAFGLSENVLCGIVSETLENFGRDFEESLREKKKLSCSRLLSSVRFFMLNKFVLAESLDDIEKKASELSNVLSCSDLNVIVEKAKALELSLSRALSKKSCN